MMNVHVSKTLAQILQESLDKVTPPDSYHVFVKHLTRPDDRPQPVLPVIHEAPENRGSAVGDSAPIPPEL